MKDTEHSTDAPENTKNIPDVTENSQDLEQRISKTGELQRYREGYWQVHTTQK